jgi:hypothetical protein
MLQSQPEAAAMLGSPLLHTNCDEPMNTASSQTSDSFEGDLDRIVAMLRRPDMQPVVAALGSLIHSGASASCDIKPKVPAVFPPAGNEARRRTIVSLQRSRKVFANNLALVVFLWTIIGCLFIYAADATASSTAAYAIFIFYSIVQGMLISSIMFTTLRQVPVNNVSLLFLIQSWLALTLAFASVYLFLQQALGVGLTADLNSTLYHTAFGSVCIVGENSTLPGRSRIEGCLSLFVSNYDQVCTLCVCLAGIRIFLYNDLVVLLLSSSPSRIRSISHWLMSSTT